MTTIPVTVQQDRAAGTVLASAAGDALGAPYEFGPALPADVAVTMKGGGAFGFAPGEWTDDTQMALAVLTALADPDPRATDPLPAVEAGFRAWFASGPADVGTQTTAGCQQDIAPRRPAQHEHAPRDIKEAATDLAEQHGRHCDAVVAHVRRRLVDAQVRVHTAGTVVAGRGGAARPDGGELSTRSGREGRSGVQRHSTDGLATLVVDVDRLDGERHRH